MFALFVLYPLVANVWLSLHEWDGAGARRWVGAENYRALLSDPAFAVALANNARWLVSYLLAPVLGLAIALLLSRRAPGMRLVRSLFFMPFVLSQVVVGLMFAWFFHARLGLFVALLERIGLPAFAPLDNEGGAIYALITAGLWPQTAYCTILYLTGLATLRLEIVEAARIDGASGWSLLRHAVLPQLGGVHFIALMVCVVSALRRFDYVVVMTNGGPHGSSTVLAHLLVEQTFVGARFGQGAATATVLLALMSAIILVLLVRLMRAESVR